MDRISDALFETYPDLKNKTFYLLMMRRILRVFPMITIQRKISLK